MQLTLAGAHLRMARDHLKKAKAERPAKRVSSALRSLVRLSKRRGNADA
jgi:hypothetical protein